MTGPYPLGNRDCARSGDVPIGHIAAASRPVMVLVFDQRNLAEIGG